VNLFSDVLTIADGGVPLHVSTSALRCLTRRDYLFLHVAFISLIFLFSKISYSPEAILALVPQRSARILSTAAEGSTDCTSAAILSCVVIIILLEHGNLLL
jgi:hypothetical protein